MRLLLQFSRRFLYRHPGQLLLALAGIAAGVAVVTGVMLVRDVLLGSLDDVGSALAGRETVRLIYPGGLVDESHFEHLASQPGAPALVPVLSAPVRVKGQLLELVALDPFSLADGGPMRVSGPATGALLGQGHVALINRRTKTALGLSLDDTITVRYRGQDLPIRLLAEVNAGPALDNRLIMDLAAAQDLLGQRGQLSWIEADRHDEAWLAERLPAGHQLSRAESRQASVARLTQGMRSNLTAMSLLALLVGLFVVHSAFSFLLVQRQRQIGMLRAIGTTPGQLLAALTLETLLLAGLGALLGLAAGILLSDTLLTLVRAPMAELYGLVGVQQVRPSGMLLMMIGVSTLLLALLSMSRLLARAMAIPPGQLSRQQEAHASAHARGPLVLAALLIVTALAVIRLDDSLPGALFALFLLLSGCALLAPMAGMALLGLAHRLGRRRLGGRAIGMLRSARQRVSPALAALSLALGLSAGIVMMVIGFRVSVDEWIDRLLRAPMYLTVQGGAIEPAVLQQIQGWPEVIEISSVRERQLVDGRRLLSYELPEQAWGGFDWLAPSHGVSHAAFDLGDGLIVSEPLARRDAIQVGDRVDIPGPGGSRTFAVLGIYRDYASDRGALALSGRVYRAWFDDPLRDSLGLYLADGVDRLPDARLDSLATPVQVTRRESVREQTLAVFDRTFRVTWALALLVGLIAVIALTSALMALGLERQRDYATLRALGLSPRRLAAWVMTQTVGLAAAAALLAVPISLLIHLVLSLVIQPRAFGWTLALSVPWQAWIFLLPIALTAGLLAGLYPARIISRRSPAPLLRSHG